MRAGLRGLLRLVAASLAVPVTARLAVSAQCLQAPVGVACCMPASGWVARLCCCGSFVDCCCIILNVAVACSLLQHQCCSIRVPASVLQHPCCSMSVTASVFQYHLHCCSIIFCHMQAGSEAEAGSKRQPERLERLEFERLEFSHSISRSLARLPRARFLCLLPAPPSPAPWPLVSSPPALSPSDARSLKARKRASAQFLRPHSRAAIYLSLESKESLQNDWCVCVSVCVRAVVLNPSPSAYYVQYAYAYTHPGDAEEADLNICICMRRQ